MDFVKTILAQISPINEDGWRILKSHLSMQKIKKDEDFISLGDQPDYFAFIKNGLFKISYTVEANGKEIIKLFNGPGDLIGAYADYLRKHPSRVSITALTDAEICRIAFKDIERLAIEIPEWEIYRRKIAEFHYLLKEDKEYELLVNSAEERYEIFLKKFSAFRNDIPDYLVAAYLNITPSYLSTMKRRLKL